MRIGPVVIALLLHKFNITYIYILLGLRGRFTKSRSRTRIRIPKSLKQHEC